MRRVCMYPESSMSVTPYRQSDFPILAAEEEHRGIYGAGIVFDNVSCRLVSIKVPLLPSFGTTLMADGRIGPVRRKRMTRRGWISVRETRWFDGVSGKRLRFQDRNVIFDKGSVRLSDSRYFLTSAGTGSVQRRYDPAFQQSCQVACREGSFSSCRIGNALRLRLRLLGNGRRLLCREEGRQQATALRY
jgi:hypothetical protein